MADTKELYDITLIGAGPVGLFGVFYAGMRGMKTKVIEALPEVGGQLTALYPEKDIFDVAGFPRISAKQLVEQCKEQADRANPGATYVFNQRVEHLNRLEDGTFELVTHTGERHYSKAVLITAGIGAFEPNRIPNESARQYEGKGVFYSVSNLPQFEGKRVLVIGGGDSAVDYALMTEPIAQDVTLIHRRDGFRAHEESLKKLAESRVHVKVFYELRRVEGDGNWVKRATIFDNRTGEETTLDVDYVILGTGFKASLGNMLEWGLEIENKKQIVINSKGETNIPGVYAAGDIAWYPGKIRLIATGFGEVATAVNNAKAYVHPGSAAFPGHSSEQTKK
ncbi:MAG: NAD(P)/FAD-dependent oxidoreductase [Symbiobacterium sp.]|uniref:NAD(P)/FAD-dependent oxidoreductase n=1 Tax=Symbiobacterium sp. TaxID=1971213 RepID=UPI0034644FD6